MAPAKQKPSRYLLVDYENIQKIDASKIPTDVRIVVFIGKHQKTLPLDLVMKSQPLGSRLEWRQIEGNGSNALDFVIAYNLGEIFDKTPNAICFILSKDKGFDPLLVMLKKKNRNCTRIENIFDIKA